MPLFIGFTPHGDPYMTLSFLTHLGGSQAQVLWDFLHQTMSNGTTIRNVLTYEIDDKSLEKIDDDSKSEPESLEEGEVR